MLEKINTFLKAHSITTHSIAVLIAGTVTAYDEVPQFHAWAQSFYHALPQSVATTIMVAAAVYAWYRKGQVKQLPLQK